MFFSVTDSQNCIPVDKIRYDERGLVPAIVQDY
ncbi:MAG: bifunctional phosphoribosyl-AMP cyclohydrolase/phosphoribosyl-ATP diphosphatase, partial [Cyanobacteria bacterium J06649_11]